ncbi:MAG: DUF805 domain-containing protein [Streptococcaceae bacterium]|nr:DUF805 domain-containing protein [Streptococcaceae bacterium]
MATKQQWLEYFKLMNNREPSLEEFQKAIEKGEIDELKGENSSQPLQDSHSEQQMPQPTISQPSFQNASVSSFLPRPENKAQRTSDHHVSLFEAYKLFWKNYVNFTGRSRRSEYWWTFLINAVISIIIFIPGIILLSASLFSLFNHMDYYSYGNTGSLAALMGGALLLFFPPILFGLAVIIPELSLFFRRLRDTGLETLNAVALIVFHVAFYVLSFLPKIGFLFDVVMFALWIYVIILLARESDYFENRSEPVSDWFVRLFKK